MGFRDALRKIDNIVDKAADATIAANRALTTTRGQSLRGKTAEAVRAKYGKKKNKCGNCPAKIADDAITCNKAACIRDMATQWESMHPDEQVKFIQRSKLRRKSEGWIPSPNFKGRW